MIDQDDVNVLSSEDYAQRRDERETKNRILNIFNPTRRTEEWKKHFGVIRESSDDYLLGTIF